MSEYVRGERLREFCEKNHLGVTSVFDETRNKKIFTFYYEDNHALQSTFDVEVDGTRYIARGEQAEIELVQVAQRKLNQILAPKKEKWYD